MQAVILCGGQGTRLGELASEKPKSLIEVAGRPFVDWQIEALVRCGFLEIVLCAGHLGGKLEQYLRDPDKARTPGDAIKTVEITEA